MAESKTPNAPMRVSDASYEIVCRPCRTDKNEVTVNYFCDECLEHLCIACRQKHTQIQITKDHIISSTKVRRRHDILSSVCACDKRQPVKFLCEQHNDAICDSCMHKRHRKCATTCVTIKGGKSKSAERKAIAKKRRYDTKSDLHSKPVKYQKSKTANKSAAKASSRLRSDNIKHSSKSKTTHGVFGKSVAQVQSPSAAITINKTRVSSDKPEQNAPRTHNKQRTTNSLIPRKVTYIRSVNIGLGPATSVDFTNHWVSSLCFMPNGCPVLVEFSNDTVKVLDKDTFEIKGFTQLCASLADVAVVGEETVIVAICFKKRLQYVQIFPEVLPGKEIQLPNECYGVDVFEEEIFVAVKQHLGEPGGDIRVLDLNGNIKRNIKISPDVHKLVWPRHLTVDKSDGTIFMSDNYTSTLLCLTRDGDVLFRYNDEEIEGLFGLCLDREGNVYACGDKSRNIQLISKTGRKIGTFLDLSNIGGLEQPRCIALRESDGLIIIGGRYTDQIHMFQMTK